jgi:hypothetical protein
MNDELRREIRRLRRTTAMVMALLIIVTASAFVRSRAPTNFEEINVERINVVEKDGKLRLVISNRARSPGPIAYGKPFGYAGGSRPGMIFFNDEGSENGGLTFTGIRKADGTYSSSGHLSFDQYNQDQVVVLQYIDDNGRQRKGLFIMDRANVPIVDLVRLQDSIQKLPAGAGKDAALKKFMEPQPGEPLAAQRIFVGRDNTKSAMVVLSDKMGHPRLRLGVDSLGRASLDFLDAAGNVTRSLSDSVSTR